MGTNGKEKQGLREGMRSLIEQELLTLSAVQRATAKATKTAAAGPGISGPAAATEPAPADQRLQADVMRLALAALGVPAERFDARENLANYGVDSIAITELMAQISRFLGVSIAPTTFFEARNLHELCAILRARFGPAVDRHYAAAPASLPPAAAPKPVATVTPPAASPPPAALAAIDAWLSRHGVHRSAAPALTPVAADDGGQSGLPHAVPAAPIAIIAMAGKFPGSPDLEAFRAHLRQGDDCIQEIPADRWDWRSVWGDPKQGAFCDVKYGGFITGHDQFDAAFFNISPKEAELMDPQHRLFIECAWQLIENAGYAPSALSGRKVSIFLGINLLDYVDLANRQGGMEAMQLTGLGHAFCPNRLSFMLDVHGPSEVIDTACSSSLVAVHRAIMSIRHEGCEMAIAGGSNLLLTPTQHIMFSKVGMLSHDGRCKTFAANANGYVRAEGVGAVLLKRLDLAERDGDNILAVIRGSAENHGGTASSLTAPNSRAQARLIVEAHRQADIDPRSVTLVECHGTGTALGDPIEVEGLKRAFDELYRARGLIAPAVPHCGLGSVKSNIGHAETAAGVAGLIKLVLALEDGICYQSLHCAQSNPLIELERTPFSLLTAARPWLRPVIDGKEFPRRAGISSFGAGGANAHLVVEEYRAHAVQGPVLAGPVVVPLSARNETTLRAAVESLMSWLVRHEPVGAEEFSRLVFTLQTGRDAMRCRLACPAADARQLVDALAGWLRGDPGSVFYAQVPRGNASPSAILDPATQSASVLAARWVEGADVDWMTFWHGRQPRRMVLPGYVFQHKRYWLPSGPAASSVATMASPPTRLGLQPVANADGSRFTLALSGQEFFLADHRVRGVPVLPGVAYLELVWQVAAAKGLQNFCIRQMIWQKPLQVEAPLTLEITLQDDASGWPRVEIASLGADAGRQVHAQARLAPREPLSAPSSVVLSDLLAAHSRQVSAAEVYRSFDSIGIEYGPGHRALSALYLGQDAQGQPQVLAELSLPEALAAAGFTAGLSAFALHPSLLDGAFQATLGMTMTSAAAQRTALPFALDRVDVFGPCTARMWVHVRHASTSADGSVRSLDIDLLDEHGTLRVGLRGFSTRLLAAAPEQTAGQDTLVFAADWEDASAAVATPPFFARRIVLLGSADTRRSDALARALPGCEVRRLAPSVDEQTVGFDEAAEQLLSLLQTLVAEAPRPAVAVQLQLLLEEASTSAWAGLSGMLKTAHLEHPWLWGQVIQVDAAADAAATLSSAAALFHVAELRQQAGHLRQPIWRELTRNTAPPPRPWRADGVYLITGGAGGIGRLLTHDIFAHAPGATLVLAGRSALDGARADWLAGLQAAGNRLSYRQVDMADAAAVASLIRAVRELHGRLNGVLQCAGVARDQSLVQKDAAALAQVLAAKVDGTRNLDRALADGTLDFLVLFSSISGVFGNPGQVDYAAANAFLDNFALDREARRRRGLCHGRTLSIAWPLWQAGGMGMSEETIRLMRQTTGMGTLATDAGLDVLAYALASDSSRLMVMAGDGPRLRRKVAALSTPVIASLPVFAAQADLLRGPLLSVLMDSVSTLLKVERGDLDNEVELAEYGFDSIGFTQFANAINARFGLEITPTLFFEYPTLALLAEHLAAQHAAAIAASLGISVTPTAPPAAALPVVPPLRTANEPALPQFVSTLQTPSNGETDPIVIVSVSGRFPMARDPEQLWENLQAGRDCISEIPADRWDWREWWGDAATQANRTQVKWGGFIDGLAEFDPAFFGLSGPEARAMDPQQRLLLTQAWHLLERAGHAPRSLSGSRTGVFIGIADTGYGRLAAAAGRGVEGYSMTGLAPSLGPNRISFFLNLNGPSMAIETACSSALVAIHRAVEAIHSGSCDAAIAGGVNALLLPEAFVGFSKAGMLAPDGRCKPFAATANGYARGEGLGLVLLKRLSAAEQDGDNILGVIRASMENHGGHASSLTAPNPRAQADLIRRAWRRAGIDPRTVGYIEAHGTGTPIGDPIEVEALVAAFADLEEEAAARYGPIPSIPCGIGSVKGNIGHLEMAAGAAGLTKVLLQMAHGSLVRTLHCDTLNPYLKLAGSRFQVVQENRPWPRPRDAAGRELPRRAGVSSFGFGGSNAHLVIEEYLPAAVNVSAPPAGPSMILLSARTPEQLAASAGQLADAITDAMPLSEIAWTLQVGRDAMEHRIAFLAADHAQLKQRLLAYAAGRDAAIGGIHVGQVKPHRDTLAIVDGDEEMRRAVASLPARGKHDSLLQLWVRGLAVDWRTLYPQQRALRRLPLPGYPFAQQRYWVDVAPMMAPVLASVAASVAASPRVTQSESHPASAELPVSQPVPDESVQASPVEGKSRALAALVQIAARVLEVDPGVLEPDTELGEYGFDSITMTGFATKTNEALGLSLTPADFFEFATLGRLAAHIADAPVFSARAASAEAVIEPAAPASRPYAAPAAVAEADQDDPIAIVGVSCRFPMAADLGDFWQNLIDGRDCISEIPADRWDWREVYGDPKREPTKTNIRWAGFIDGVFEFDPLFFGISPREAKLMDPQQRLLMMHVWKALEDAGHAPRSLAGRAVGLFVATSSSGYREVIGTDSGGEGYVATGAVPSVGPNRVSYFLDWHGPSEPVETACSSSLVALHRALQAMRSGDCEMAVVGGVNTIMTPEAHINFAKAGMLSPDGRCRTFSAQANGYARGEGIGMIVLRRLSDARRDGDPIYALVRGSAVNHGGRANSLTAPNTAAQSEVLKAACRRAGVEAGSISYIEAHGTGTPLGDPVEINALKSAYRDLGVVAGPAVSCGIGSVKTHIGHLELAAGMAGIIKVLLQMRHATLVRNLHGEEVNPYIDLSGSPFFIVDKNQPWVATRDATGALLPRRAGISSFGFGGVNAHVVLEAYPQSLPDPTASGQPVIVPLSARDEARLRDQVDQLLNVLDGQRYQQEDLPDLAWTLQVGREAMKYRLAVVVTQLSQLAAELRAWRVGQDNSVRNGCVVAGQPPAVGSLMDMADQWVRGAEVNWATLRQGARRRLNLPTYPFARESYRVGPAVSSSASLPAESGLPCAMHLIADGVALCTLDAEAFYLRDHRVRGVRLLPGAMSVELARLAHALSRGASGEAVTLAQVVWLQPLTAGAAPLLCRIELAPESPGNEGRQQFQLRAGSAPGGAVHVKGLIGPLVVGPQPLPSLDLKVLRLRCTRAFSADWLYQRYGALGLDYGPSFRVVTDLQVGQDEFLARLELPPAAVATSANMVFGIHPVLLDGAFQACLGLFAEAAGAGQAALPFVLETLHFYRSMPATLWVHGRLVPGGGAVRRIDLDIGDDAGQICIQVRGFSVRLQAHRVDPAAQSVAATTETVAAGMQRYLSGLVAAEASLAVSDIDPTAALEAYGIDSIMITRLTDQLELDFGTLPRTLFFDHQTLHALAAYFLQNHPQAVARITGGGTAASGAVAQVAPPPQNSQPEKTTGDIAIIGLAGRYPGASNLQTFWANLAAGRDSISEVPASRWDHSAYYDPIRGAPGKTNSKWGGFIDDYDCFDPQFFNIAPREAAYLDPQERLFLQCAWETLEDAGYTRAALSPAQAPLTGANVGVFVGVMYEEYQLYGAESTQRGEPLALAGSAASIANRVSYFCNFHGPSLAVDSMCSSSLTAIHLACESLRAGSCEAALAGGVNLTLHPNKYLALAQGRFTSSKGRCESFGEGGDGYVPGEGVGAVLLKPLAQAEADGDRIYAVIRGSALNHGGKTNGYAVPNPHAQEAVIVRAMARANVNPAQVSYIEAHGTGTRLGDPIEIAALSRAFGGETGGMACAIGSVKSNIGHAESAAGIAGLTKLLLQLQHGQLVPSLHSERLNPHIDFAATPFVVQRSLQPWPPSRENAGGKVRPRIAGLSSFGAGGANAHLVIEEYFPAPVRPETVFTVALPGVFPFSARDPLQLREALARMRQALDTLDETALPAVAAGLQMGREAFEVRVVVVAVDRQGLLDGLDALLSASAGPEGVQGRGKNQASPWVNQLAAQWAEGKTVDWHRLWVERRLPVKISLPTYPFARQHYWVPSQTAATGASTTQLARVAHLSSPSKPPPLLFAPDWRLSPALPTMSAVARIWVVLCEPDHYAARTRRRQDGGAGSEGELIGEIVASALAPVELRILDHRGAAEESPIHQRYTAYAEELLGMIQALLRDRPTSALIQVVVPLAGEARLFEGFSGLLRTAQLEHPTLRFQLIALADEVTNLADLLRLEQASADAQVRYQGGQRQVRAWRELLLPRDSQQESLWRDDGVYLISGGGGGIGLLLAEEIALRTRNSLLCLVGRSAPGQVLQDRLARISAQTIYRQADIGQEGAAERLVEELLQHRGRIDGIVHAAGITRDKLIVRKQREELGEVLAPKVAGLYYLDRASAACNLDFVLLFASASGALGNPGQADYACANAWLDSFAEYRNQLLAQGQRHGATLAIDWPYWQEGGMRMDAGLIQSMVTATGVQPLTTEQGLRALNLAWRTREAGQVLVLDGEPERIRRLLGLLAQEGSPDPQPGAPDDRETPDNLRQKTIAWLTDRLADVLGMPPSDIGPEQVVDRYGVDSVLAMQMIEMLERDLGSLPQTLLFEYPSMAALATALLASHGPVLTTLLADKDPAPVVLAASRMDKAVVVASPSPAVVDDIAVIAVAGRYPGAETIEEFWALLQAGRDCVTEIPAARWDSDQFYSPRKGQPHSSYCKWGGFLEDVDCFDPGFFGLSPRDAILMDPQERLFLQTIWHLLERGGHTRELLRQRYASRVGVYVGAMYQPYHGVDTDEDSRTLVALSSNASMANRVSFFFDLQGPSVAVDTLCSSGLQAVHLAVQSLRRGECDLAIAGGVNLTLSAGKYVGLSRAGMLGSHADSRSFMAGDGYLPAEGVGAVLLKPLADALRDGDPIIALIKASAANHGGHSAGYGVPNGEVQTRLIADNFRQAGIDPHSVGYVEAAANGSALGDAIEFRALTRAFQQFTAEEGFCAIGSVKSNMGHAESASGLAQLTKVLLQLEHKQLVPGVSAGPLSPHLQFAGTPFRLQRTLADWDRTGEDTPRRATVSSFGAGGSNVHLILEEAPMLPVIAGDERRQARRFFFSARDAQRLTDLLGLMRDYLLRYPGLSMARLAATLQYRREPMACACTIVAMDQEDLIARLADGIPADDETTADVAAADPTLPPLLLPGYPFAREHYWLPNPAPPFAPAAETKVEAEVRQAVLAETEILSLILELLATELVLDRAGLAEATSFRALGADSMVGLRLIFRIAEATGVELGHGDLEHYPTPAVLAAYVAERIAETPQTESRRWQNSEQTSAPADPLLTVFPLSEGQQGLWRWQQLYPDSSAYNLPLAFRVAGIDLPALAQTCDAVLSAWPLLGCRIVARNETEFEWQSQAVTDQVTLLSVAAGAPIEVMLRERARIPFDLLATAPIRFELLREAREGQDVLLILLHHIVFDGLSAAHFSHYFWQVYAHLVAGKPLPPPPPAASFAEFVGWERDYLKSAAGQADLAYWQEQLADEPTSLALPQDRRPVAGQPLVGNSLERSLPPDLVTASRACAQKLGIDLSAFFLGALHVLLYRYSGQQDILIGMPVLGRPERRFEQAVGYFVNLLPMRNAVRGELAAGEFLRTIQKRLTAGLDHAAWPFALLAARADTRIPVQIIYSWQNFLTPQDLSGIAGIPVNHLAGVRQEGDVPLALEFYAEGEELRLVAAFDQGRFDPETIERLVDHYLCLVASICADTDAAIGSLDMLSATERQHLLLDWSGVRASPSLDEASVEVRIARQAMLTPDAAALVVGDQRLSYRQLQERVDQLAACLRQWGVCPGQPVAVLLKRGAGSIVALLATLKTGAIWVPLDADYPDQRLAYILADAAPALVVAEASTRGRLPVGDVPVLLIDRPRGASECLIGNPSPVIEPDTPAYLIYTSGSTGRPKGVAVSRRALAVHCAAVMAHYRLSDDDRVLQFASHHVDAALEQILPTLASGACLVMRENEVWLPAALAELLTREGVSVADLPPAYLREVLQAWAREPVILSCPRLLIVGGEVLTPELVRLWQASPLAGARFLNAYGPTEATITATVHEIHGDDLMRPSLAIGRPLAGGWVYILDRDGNPVPEGVVGELVIGGPRVALGYWGHPDLAAECFRPDFNTDAAGGRIYHSGDLASFIPGSNGLIAFHGRRDHQIKIRGFRIELEEIEAVLRSAGAENVLVIALPRPGGDPGLVAYVATEGQSFGDEAGLRRFVAERLPAAMRPAVYVFLDRLPSTPGGKLDRQALSQSVGGALGLPRLPGKDSIGSCRPASAECSPAADEVEAKLAAIWCELLGISAVSAADDFFMCGGHSLLVLRLLGSIRQVFGRKLSMSALQSAPTLGQQAGLLRGQDSAAQPSPLVLLNGGGGKASPLFCPHPVGGGVDCYRALATFFEGKRPVYGLQSFALEQGGASPESVSDMAAALLAALRTIQPHGPYHLAGWSMGGVLAYEMAQQLTHAGERVALLALLDSYTPALLAKLEAAQSSIYEDALAREQRAFDYDMGELAAAGITVAPQQAALLFEIFQVNLHALQSYVPAPYHGPMHLLVCALPDVVENGVADETQGERYRGWGSLARSGLSVIDLPGDHYSILRMPNVVQVAERLEKCLGDGSTFAK